ncbi:hypothetical protein B0T11DRAFT_271580 [Plectosphaerella cucumerina]|uniref:Ester cyclase n=1 Tax=Plectosphaerella cucumerina TaxID=40658 RepID=A0A8K0TRN7_9PEZI|nr:hypothetical protein B0T11DRAFT_271580 [Plectosphaerella cucumerina]
MSDNSPEVLRSRLARFLEFINSGDETIGSEVVSDSAVFHVPFGPGALQGLAGYMQILGMMRGAYPDIQWSLEETVVEGQLVVARFSITGTHLGDFFGHKATGRPIRSQAMNLYKFSDGKIVEERGLPDMFGMMVQIGAIEPPAPK